MAYGVVFYVWGIAIDFYPWCVKRHVYTIVNKEGTKATSKKVIIETGQTQGDFIEVLSGLTHNDEIIQEGARSVEDGQIVKILTVE